jgi:hypothetical protein
MTDAHLEPIIERHGWAVLQVESPDETRPNWAYSIGLMKSFGHPEVIAFGLPSHVLEGVINGIGEAVRVGKRFTDGSMSGDVIEGYSCAFREAATAAVQHYMGAAVRYYGRVMPALHCIWPDKQGRFPWQTGTSPEYRRLQPMLHEGPEPFTHVAP